MTTCDPRSFEVRRFLTIRNRKRTKNSFYIEAVLASLKMDRSMADFRSTKNFAHMSRDVPLFSSLDELHEKLTELLGNFSINVRFLID